MGALTRYAALISYDGSAFHGFQRQRNLLTVQAVLEETLSILNQENVKVTCAGRTDSGVHALGQVIHFDMCWPHDSRSLRRALQANLPPTIGVFDVASVSNDFNARKSALWRKYVYFIWKGESRLPHLNKYLWWNKNAWDMEKARSFLAMIEGCHDFGAFCRKADRPLNTRRTISEAGMETDGFAVKVTITGRSFLTNMVRIIIGTMDQIATGRKSLSDVGRLLEEGSREDAGLTAPAKGLFLWQVQYDPLRWNITEYIAVARNFVFSLKR